MPPLQDPFLGPWQFAAHLAVCSAGIATNAVAAVHVNRKFNIGKHTIFLLASGFLALHMNYCQGNYNAKQVFLDAVICVIGSACSILLSVVWGPEQGYLGCYGPFVSVYFANACGLLLNLQIAKIRLAIFVCCGQCMNG